MSYNGERRFQRPAGFPSPAYAAYPYGQQQAAPSQFSYHSYPFPPAPPPAYSFNRFHVKQELGAEERGWDPRSALAHFEPPPPPENRGALAAYFAELSRYKSQSGRIGGIACRLSGCGWRGEAELSLGDLERHVLRHATHVLPYRCHLCRATLADMAEHMKAHFGERASFEDLRGGLVSELLRALARTFAPRPPKGPVEVVELSDSDDSKAPSPVSSITRILEYDLPVSSDQVSSTSRLASPPRHRRSSDSSGCEEPSSTVPTLSLLSCPATPPAAFPLPELASPRIAAELAERAALPACRRCAKEVPKEAGPVLAHLATHAPTLPLFRCKPCGVYMNSAEAHAAEQHEDEPRPEMEARAAEAELWGLYADCFPQPPPPPPPTEPIGMLSVEKPPSTVTEVQKATPEPKPLAKTKVASRYQDELESFCARLGLETYFIICRFRDCGKHVKPSRFSLDTHALKHFDGAVYACKLCTKPLKFPARHFETKHPGQSQSLDDRRPKMDARLVAHFRACFQAKPKKAKKTASGPERPAITIPDEGNIFEKLAVTSAVQTEPPTPEPSPKVQSKKPRLQAPAEKPRFGSPTEVAQQAVEEPRVESKAAEKPVMMTSELWECPFSVPEPATKMLDETLLAPPTKPSGPQPQFVEPKPAEPKPTVPKPAEPKTTEPEITEPKPTEPMATEPKPTEPKATEPEPTELMATEPKPTEPKASEPSAVCAAPEEGRKPLAFLALVEAQSRTRGGLSCRFEGCTVSYRRLNEGFLALHVLSHSLKPAFKCNKCGQAVNSTRQHAKSAHPEADIGSGDFIDRRADFEPELIALARRCFGEPPPPGKPKQKRVKKEPTDEASSPKKRRGRPPKVPVMPGNPVVCPEQTVVKAEPASESSADASLDPATTVTIGPTDFRDIGEPTAPLPHEDPSELRVTKAVIRRRGGGRSVAAAILNLKKEPLDAQPPASEEEGLPPPPLLQPQITAAPTEASEMETAPLPPLGTVKVEPGTLTSALEEETRTEIKTLLSAVRRRFSKIKTLACLFPGCQTMWTCLKNIDGLMAHVTRHAGLDAAFHCLTCDKPVICHNSHHYRSHKGQPKRRRDLRPEFREQLLQAIRDYCLGPDARATAERKKKGKKAAESDEEVAPSKAFVDGLFGPMEVVEMPRRHSKGAKEASNDGIAAEMSAAELNERTVRLYQALIHSVGVEVAHGRAVRCQFYSCQTKYEELVELDTLDRHVLCHVGKPGYLCRLCKATANSPADHRRRNHPDHEGPLKFRDLRPSFAGELLTGFRDCFPDITLEPRTKARRGRRTSVPKPPSPLPSSPYLAFVKTLSRRSLGFTCQRPECVENGAELRRFRGTEALNAHVLSHADVDCFSCEACSAPVRKPLAHMASVHPGQTAADVVFKDIRSEHEEALLAVAKSCFEFASEMRVVLSKLEMAEGTQLWAPESPQPPPGIDESMIQQAMALLSRSVDLKAMREAASSAPAADSPTSTTMTTTTSPPLPPPSPSWALPARVSGPVKCSGPGCGWRLPLWKASRAEEHLLDHLGVPGFKCRLCGRRTRNLSLHQIKRHPGQPRDAQDLRPKIARQLLEAKRRYFPSLKE